MATVNFPKAMLPKFQAIVPEQIESAIQEKITENKQALAQLLAQGGPYTWENLMHPLENMSDELNKLWSPISHLHSVAETESLRKAYNAALPLLTEYHTEISQNEALFKAISSIADSPQFASLDPAQQKIISNDIRDFKLAGIHLPAEQKARLAELQKELTQLTTTFSEHVLDATQGFTITITDQHTLAGLPHQALQLAIDNAKARNVQGFVLTLDYPSYSTAIKFLHDRELRKTLYEAYSTRASDCGPNAGRWDNTPIIDNILRVRREIAAIIGFKNYADYSLATRMAKTTDEVLHFLNDLLDRSKPMAEREFIELQKYAKSLDNIDQLEAWDTPYYSEKLSESIFHFSQEDLRPYFPIAKVLDGLFKIVQTLYSITIKEESDVDVWHPDVKFFAIYDHNNELRGGFYTDLYARSHKRDGAWMDECRVRRRLDNQQMQYAVAYLTCNFMPPVADKPALLTHDDVLTLFHEFGHGLHHMLSKIDYPSVSGINGVPWDAVEFPSQFMENFCWEKEALKLIAANYQTGEPLPDDLYIKMLDGKHFETGLQMVRQLEFALFDFRLHIEFDPSIPGQVQLVLNDVRSKTSVIKAPDFNRFQDSFSHIFAGGYAAGYYSYKWAEVLSADAYSMFEEHGIFDQETGLSFMQNILETGGVRDPMTSFIAFRKREPSIDALLRHSGIIQQDAVS